MKASVWIGLIALAALTGCATVPDSIVMPPPAAKAPQAAPIAPANGSIFQMASHRPLFEDRRARMVGDVLTIVINEKTSAGKAATTTDSKTSSVDFSAPKIFGVPATTTAQSALAIGSANKFENKGAISSSNNFSGTIGVTVVEVHPNGNLVVRGEKQIALDKSAEYVRFSGVVSPDSIVGNSVSSTQVADARVEYRTNSRLDAAEMMSQFARFFLSLSPL